MPIHKSFKAFEKSISKRLDRYAKDTVKQLGEAIIDYTPYITTRLQSNWKTSIGSADFSFSEHKMDGGSTATADLSLTTSTWKVDSPLYFTNATPYAYGIEYGNSTQTPEGMLRVNVANVQAMSSINFKKYF